MGLSQIRVEIRDRRTLFCGGGRLFGGSGGSGLLGTGGGSGLLSSSGALGSVLSCGSLGGGSNLSSRS
jgi:hypothetical protein